MADAANLLMRESDSSTVDSDGFTIHHGDDGHYQLLRRPRPGDRWLIAVGRELYTVVGHGRVWG